MNGIIPQAGWVNKILPYSNHWSTEIAGIVQRFLSHLNQTAWRFFLPPAGKDSRCHSVFRPTLSIITQRGYTNGHMRGYFIFHKNQSRQKG